MVLRKKYGIRSGDMVYFTETTEGIVMTTKDSATARVLDELGTALKEVGASYEQMKADGDRIRAELVAEKYGLNDQT